MLKYLKNFSGIPPIKLGLLTFNPLTTELAAITLPSDISLPAKITALSPIQQQFPIFTAAASPKIFVAGGANS
jgi:hypothetical protein